MARSWLMAKTSRIRLLRGRRARLRVRRSIVRRRFLLRVVGRANKVSSHCLSKHLAHSLSTSIAVLIRQLVPFQQILTIRSRPRHLRAAANDTRTVRQYAKQRHRQPSRHANRCRSLRRHSLKFFSSRHSPKGFAQEHALEVRPVFGFQARHLESVRQ
jgi:hypothetical protein